MRRVDLVAATLAVTLVLFVGGCGEDATGPATGDIEVTLTITGVDLDADGAMVSCDGETERMLVPDVPVTFFQLPEGDHVLMLTDLNGNCQAEQNPRAVSVSSGETSQTTFAVTCAGPDPQLDLSKVAVAMVPGG